MPVYRMNEITMLGREIEVDFENAKAFYSIHCFRL